MEDLRFDEASLPQITAANPETSSWVSANAGSGKTRVLTDRVARLLLAGTPPEKILCLTFTKAAASNMQNRLIESLGKWAMLEDDPLTEMLLDLGANRKVLSSDSLKRARTLFAQALETPGGLKIQTIHAFSTALLRRFPLEAGVSPQFAMIEDRNERQLQEAVLEGLADAGDEAFDRFAGRMHMDALLALVREIAGNRDSFSSTVSQASIWKRFGVDPALDEQTLCRRMFRETDVNLLNKLRAFLRIGSATEVKAEKLLAKMDFGQPGVPEIETLERIFLYGKSASDPFGSKSGAFPTKGTRAEMNAKLALRVDAYMDRVCENRRDRTALNAASKTLMLHRFAHAFLREYELRMRDGAFLDFDALILKALELVTNSDMAQWVLFRLDGGIDHILVDEAQDVSPEQWKIVANIAEEFTSGSGARGDLDRTVFAVGDEKQSIYGFQGAAPEKFAEMKKHFESRFDDAKKPFVEESLEFSFRSSQAILDLVDEVFNADGAGFGDNIVHRAFKSTMPGRVDLWPFIHKTERDDPLPWHDPGNEAESVDEETTLARNIAVHTRNIILEAMIPDGEGGARKARPGDILILVQRRSDLFYTIIQELKVHDIPVAGSDRLRVSEELAIKDLLGLLSFLALPGDDLSLAAVLKSPLFGLDEGQLFGLAHDRGNQSLWRALLQSDDFPDARETLRDLLGNAGRLSPYDLLERILTVHRGREKLVARLGHEIDEAVDALLSRALDYEDEEAATLTGFLHHTSADDQEVKRQLDQAGDEVRVMTVHGAKGLESPVVILPDTAKRQVSFMDNLLFDEDGMPLMKVAKDESPPIIEDALAKFAIKEELERRRLLYVALTRAESWLIVCGAGNIQNLKPEHWCWYDRISYAIERLEGVKDLDLALDEVDESDQPGRRFQFGNWPDAPAEPEPEAEAKTALEDWVETPAVSPSEPPATRAPSDLGGEKSVAGDADQTDRETAMERGTRLHLLLEMLPGHAQDDREKIARNLLFQGDEEISEAEFSDIFAECAKILDNADLQHVFAEGALAEVGIAAHLDGLGGEPILGYIDRLLIGDNKVLAVDFKSNRIVPATAEETPEGILRQMGAYQEALEALYPSATVEVAILWTRSAQLMHLPRDACLAALGRAGPLDATAASS